MREMAVKIPSPESVAETRKGLPSGGCWGVVFERSIIDSGTRADPSLGASLFPHVNCRRRGLEEGPVTTRGTAAPFKTVGDYLLAEVTRGSAWHALACTVGKISVIIRPGRRN